MMGDDKGSMSDMLPLLMMSGGMGGGAGGGIDPMMMMMMMIGDDDDGVTTRRSTHGLSERRPPLQLLHNFNFSFLISQTKLSELVCFKSRLESPCSHSNEMLNGRGFPAWLDVSHIAKVALVIETTLFKCFSPHSGV